MVKKIIISLSLLSYTVSLFGMQGGWQQPQTGWYQQQQPNNGWNHQWQQVQQPQWNWNQQHGWQQQPAQNQWQPQANGWAYQQPQLHWWNPWSWNQPRVSVKDLVNQRLQNMERYIKNQLFNLLGISEYQFEQFKNSPQLKANLNKVDIDSYYAVLDRFNQVPYVVSSVILRILMQQNMDPTRIAVFASNAPTPATSLVQGIGVNLHVLSQTLKNSLEMESIILHEIAHIKNNDSLDKLCLMLLGLARKQSLNLHEHNRFENDYKCWENSLYRFKELSADMYALLQNIYYADALGNYNFRTATDSNDCHHLSATNRISYCRLIRDMLIEESWGRSIDNYLPILDNLMYQAVHV